MKKILWFSWTFALFAFSSFAQTNIPPASLPHFFLPPVQLWQPAVVAEDTSTNLFDAAASLSNAGSPGRMSLNTTADDGEFRSRVIRPGEFYLVEKEPSSENRFVRAAEAIWSPEVVRIGRTSVSCSVLTAIKRKNPLCLLNPIFFQASW